MKSFKVKIKDAHTTRVISVLAKSWHAALEIVRPQLDETIDAFVTVKPA
jgi:hypothetical protein